MMIEQGMAEADVMEAIRAATGYWLGNEDWQGWEGETDRLNQIAQDLNLFNAPLSHGDDGDIARSKINAIISALDIPEGADLYHDYQAGRYYGLPAPSDTHATNILVPNAAGVYETFAPDVLVRNGEGLWTLPTETNYVPEPSMASAVAGVIGSGGAWPSTMVAQNMSGQGATAEIKGTGVEHGLPYMEVRLFGSYTGDNAQNMNLGFLTSSARPIAVQGDTVTVAFGLKVLSGLDSVNSIQARVSENLPEGGYVAQNTRALTGVVENQFGWHSHSPVIADATTGLADGRIVVRVLTGIPFDITLRIYAPLVSKSKFASMPILGNSGAATQRVGNAPRINLPPTPNGFCFVSLIDRLAVVPGGRFMAMNPGNNSRRLEIFDNNGSGAPRLTASDGTSQLGSDILADTSLGKKALVLGFSGEMCFGYCRSGVGSGETTVALAPEGLSSLALGSQGFTAINNHYIRTLKLAGFYDFSHYAEAKALADDWYAEAAA